MLLAPSTYNSTEDVPFVCKGYEMIQHHSPLSPENDFLGPYNKLLHALFPADSEYTVILRSYSFSDSYGAAKAIFEFKVIFEDNPVFLLQIKGPRGLTVNSTSEKADDQMRKRMRDLAPNCPLDTLHGISAFGTRLSFYSYNKQTCILPKRVLPDRERETDSAPSSRWDCDILEDEGGQRFQGIISEIKARCDEL
ncbi:uncharacterized protein ARMOST_17924 [Armillaria ostoyae]|uniref:Uncharacterized protein n=1 Tax=Armillaria ostoyae TaxID=47428 RepID=A0A284S0G5_ARMOS|nr:uncharacterized protein ARMOST_17924 [Armillaria ostoyae]